MENVKERIARIENAEHVIKCARMSLSIQNEFELACLRELVAVTEQVRLLTEQRDAVVAESSGIQKRMQLLVDIINNADNSYCMCGDAMKSHGHGGCGSPTGMFDYHYGRWVESETETPATDAAIAALRAEVRSNFVDDAVAAISESGALTVGDCIVAVCQLRESKGAQG